MAEPLAQFRPSSSSRTQRLGPPASHYAGFPGSGAPVSSTPRRNPNWSHGHENAQWNAAPNRTYANPHSGGKCEGGGKGQGGSQGGYGNSQFVSNAITPLATPVVTPIQTLSATTLPNLPPRIKCISCKLAKRPYKHNNMTCPLIWESEEAKNFNHRGVGCSREQAPAKSHSQFEHFPWPGESVRINQFFETLGQRPTVKMS